MARVLAWKKEGYTLVELAAVVSILGILAAIAIYSYSTPRKQAYNAVAQEDLRRAYTSAVAYFLDHPQGFLTQPSLARYGFIPSPQVILGILDGRPSSLILIARHRDAGAQAFIIVSENGQSAQAPGPPGHPWIAAAQGWKLENSRTGPDPLWLPEEAESPQNPESFARFLRNCDLMAQMKLAEAYAAAQAFFRSRPGDVLSLDQLVAFGYTPHDRVNLNLADGSPSSFSLSAAFETPGAGVFRLDPSGRIVPVS